MDDALKPNVLAACRRLLRPVMQLLLRNGIMHRDFAELGKAVCVEVASEDYGLQGRRTNVSRVALLTGLDRKEVKRIRDLLDEKDESAVYRGKQDRITRVLSGWYQDPEFLDDSQSPRELPREGKNASFEALVRRYGGDVPHSAMLKELMRINAVEQTSSGNLRVLQRYYMPAKTDPDAIDRAGSVLYDLGTTVYHNLYRESDQESRFEGRATNNLIDPKLVPEFHKFVEQQGQDFLEKIDRWLSSHESQNDRKGTIRLGIGMYWIEDKGSEGDE